MFQNNAWSRTRPEIMVFDDLFVDKNVYSGLSVASEHRQNLHELIPGAQGVGMNQQLLQLITQVEAHNAALRTKATAIPVSARGSMSVDDFCVLPHQADIDAAIQEAERNLAAAQEQEPIRTTPLFNSINLPAFDTTELNRILQLDLPALDAAAAAQVQAHVLSLGQEGESWVADGMRRLATPEGGTTPPCPFCAQDLHSSPVIGHYRSYFSQAYADLKRVVAEALAGTRTGHGGEIPAAFERAVRVLVERRQFWSRFCEVPEIVLDTATISREWRAAREAVAAALATKQSTPLDRMNLSEETQARVAEYEAHCETIQALSLQLGQANARINVVRSARPQATWRLTADVTD